MDTCHILDTCHIVDTRHILGTNFEVVHTYKPFAGEQLANEFTPGDKGEGDKKMRFVSAMPVVSVEHVHNRIALKKHPVRLAYYYAYGCAYDVHYCATSLRWTRGPMRFYAHMEKTICLGLYMRGKI